MKQLTTKNKVFYIAIALIIIIGIIVVALKGFNVELRYRENQEIELNIGEEVNIKEVTKIADEVFGKNKSIVQVIEVYKDAVQITARQITEEQKNNIVEKINALYSQDDSENKLINADKIKITTNANVRLRDILKPYIYPSAITIIAVLIYLVIKYYKLGIIQVIMQTVVVTVLPQIVLLSILAITRFPMGRLTSPLILFVYINSLIFITGKLTQDSILQKK